MITIAVSRAAVKRSTLMDVQGKGVLLLFFFIGAQRQKFSRGMKLRIMYLINLWREAIIVSAGGKKANPCVGCKWAWGDKKKTIPRFFPDSQGLSEGCMCWKYKLLPQPGQDWARPGDSIWYFSFPFSPYVSPSGSLSALSSCPSLIRDLLSWL